MKHHRSSLFLSVVLFLSAAFLFIGMSFSSFAQAQERSGFFSSLGSRMAKKADEKYESRWTIADWFETQRKTRLQDMWLAGRRGERSIYEFALGGGYGTVNAFAGPAAGIFSSSGTTKMGELERITGYAHAYATLVGLEASYWDMRGRAALSARWEYGWKLALAMRLLGDSQQNTNFTIYVGRAFVAESSGDQARPPFVGARATLYLTKAFGIDTSYEFWLSSTSELGNHLDGQSLEATLFLDFSFLRLYGRGRWDNRTHKTGNTKAETNLESIDGGLKIFF